MLSEDRAESVAEPPAASELWLREDRRYWFQLTVDDARITASVVADGLVVRLKPGSCTEGIIDTRSQAGILDLRVQLTGLGMVHTLSRGVEVLPVKFDLEAFRAMVDDIATRCLDLALRFSSHVRIPLAVMSSSTVAGIQQRFFFLSHLLTNDHFRLAIERITESPLRRVDAEPAEVKLSAARRLGRAASRSLASGGNRTPIPAGHPLAHLGSLPREGLVIQRIDTLDTAENRFVKFVLQQFSEQLQMVHALCERVVSPAVHRVAEEARTLRESLARTLQHSMFREIGSSSFLPIGSPVLQRRSGYREVLDAWLRFHIAATLEWDGGDAVFGGGKKDTDRLYEYWLFFQLLDVLSTHLGMPIPAPEKFLKASNDGLTFGLKAGRSFTHENVVDVGAGRVLKVKFSYNRTFAAESPAGRDGSWSLAMRPDFTISFWPDSIDEGTAERLHIIVHLHFDSKYRLDAPEALFKAPEAELQQVKADEQKGRYKRADLLVAHAYRDAIRRSGGAYILYPGITDVPTVRREYHEILPGLGAFPVRPASRGQTGIEKVGDLLLAVAKHLGNRGSARERLTYATWQIYKSPAPDAATPWLVKALEATDGERLPPPFQRVLIVECNAPLTPTWVRANGVFPLYASKGDDVIPQQLRADSVMLEGGPFENGVQFVPVDRDRLVFRNADELPPVVGQVSEGIYVLLPLILSAALNGRPRSSTSLSDLRSASKEQGTLCMSSVELASYFEILP